MSKEENKVLRFPSAPLKADYQRVQSTYTVREIKQLFGLSERLIRRWTEQGVVANRGVLSKPASRSMTFRLSPSFDASASCAAGVDPQAG